MKTLNNNNDSQNDFHKKRKILPNLEKKFLYFSMQKKNMEILQAVNFIGRALKRSSKSLSYAGNKDKRGITTQLISCYNTLPEEILSLTKKHFWDRRIFVDNFFYANTGLKLGQLKGNQFCVILRFIKGNQENIKKRIESIKNFGFLNYYGMQRFGCSSIPTHKIGLLVIRKNWEDAILNILNTNAVREILNIDDFNLLKISDILNNLEILLKKINSFRSNVEFRILKYLKSNKKSYLNAFKTLNRQLQLLYPHAYQSYIWNKTVSERIKNFNLEILIGDIVIKKGKSVELVEEELNLEELQNLEEDGENQEDMENLKNENEINNEINQVEEKSNEVNNSKNKDLYDKRKY